MLLPKSDPAPPPKSYISLGLNLGSCALPNTHHNLNIIIKNRRAARQEGSFELSAMNRPCVLKHRAPGMGSLEAGVLQSEPSRSQAACKAIPSEAREGSLQMSPPAPPRAWWRQSWWPLNASTQTVTAR